MSRHGQRAGKLRRTLRRDYQKLLDSLKLKTGATMKVTTDDGHIFEGADARAIVRAMADADWQRYDKKRDYMDDVAERVTMMTGFEVRTFAEGFVEDLATAGLIAVEAA